MQQVKIHITLESEMLYLRWLVEAVDDISALCSSELESSVSSEFWAACSLKPVKVLKTARCVQHEWKCQVGNMTFCKNGIELS